MAGKYYIHNTPFISGDTIRAEDFNAELADVEAGLNLVEEDTDNAINMTGTTSGQSILENAASRSNNVIGFDASGNIQPQPSVGVFVGAWSDSVSYQVRDIVIDVAGDISVNTVYICNTPYTPNGGDTILTGSPNWSVLIDVSGIEVQASSATIFADTASTSKTDANEWALKLGSEVDLTEFSAREYAIGTEVTTAKDEAARAETAKASVTLPAIIAGDAKKGVEVKSDISGYEHAGITVTPPVCVDYTSVFTVVAGDHGKTFVNNVLVGGFSSLPDASTVFGGFFVIFKSLPLFTGGSSAALVNLDNSSDKLNGTVNGSAGLSDGGVSKFILNAAGDGYEQINVIGQTSVLF